MSLDINRGGTAPAPPFRQVEARNIQPTILLVRPLRQLKNKFVIIANNIDGGKGVITQGVTCVGGSRCANRTIGQKDQTRRVCYPADFWRIVDRPEPAPILIWTPGALI